MKNEEKLSAATFGPLLFCRSVLSYHIHFQMDSFFEVGSIFFPAFNFNQIKMTIVFKWVKLNGKISISISIYSFDFFFDHLFTPRTTTFIFR